ncbi:MAG: divergent polysaccharide deacetylase family protein [Pseudomonadota bacterium]
MAGFRDQLDKEMERRNLVPGDDAPEEYLEPLLDDAKKVKKFSFRTFLLGLFLGTALLSLVVFWAYMNADETQKNLENKLSSKTVLVDKDNKAQIVKTVEEVKPIVAVPPQDTSPKETAAPTDETPFTPIPEYSGEGALVAAPIPGFYESLNDALVPIIRTKDGLTPFDAYKKPFTGATDKPLVSFVINNIGLSKSKTYALIDELPDNVTLAFSPYASNLNELVGAARAGGHEVWLNLPLESKEYPLRDPGPLTLLKNASEEQNTERMIKLLSTANGYAGFIPNKDHAYTEKTIKTNRALNQVFTRGLTIIDSQTTFNSFSKALANRYDSIYGMVDVWLDDELTAISLNRQIRRIIEIGTAKDQVVVMLNNYPASINAMNKFLSSAAAKDFQLAPLSSQVRYAE